MSCFASNHVIYRYTNGVNLHATTEIAITSEVRLPMPHAVCMSHADVSQLALQLQLVDLLQQLFVQGPLLCSHELLWCHSPGPDLSHLLIQYGLEAIGLVNSGSSLLDRFDLVLLHHSAELSETSPIMPPHALE